mgnify:CR=1 FL=1
MRRQLVGGEVVGLVGQPEADQVGRDHIEAVGAQLGDADIAAILAYIKSTWPPEIRARHDRLNAVRADGR